jgi:hypothetical protein
VKFTLMQVEMEGSDAGAILRGLTERFVDGRAAAAPVPERPAEAGPTALLAAPPKRKYKKVHHKGAEVAETASAWEPPKTVSAAIREAIAAGPKTNLEIQDYVVSRGLTPGSSTISTILCQMRAKNEITKFDSDLKWRPAVKPAR